MISLALFVSVVLSCLAMGRNTFRIVLMLHQWLSLGSLINGN